MKKVFLVGALALFSAVNAQTGLSIGAHVGLPMGKKPKYMPVQGQDSPDKTTSSFAAGFDIAYRFQLADNLYVGPATGYQVLIGKEIEDSGSKLKYKNTNIIPIAASAVYKITKQFGLGIDIGYGVAFGGDIKSIDGDTMETIENDGNQAIPGFGTEIVNELKDTSEAKSAFLWSPKAYFSFGKSNIWVGYQGLNMTGSTATVNLGYTYTLDFSK